MLKKEYKKESVAEKAARTPQKSKKHKAIIIDISTQNKFEKTTSSLKEGACVDILIAVTTPPMQEAAFNRKKRDEKIGVLKLVLVFIIDHPINLMLVG